MDKRIEVLGKWGCDIKDAMELMEDEDFYIECAEAIIKDPAFEKLKKYLEEKNYEEAFEYAHQLKGVLANVRLTPMYKKTDEIVKELRAGNCENLIPKVEELLKMKEYLEKILKG